MFFDESYDPERDEPHSIEYNFGKGNRLVISRDNQFGFYKISFGKGTVPKSLEGFYTSVKYAKEAATKYLSEYKQKE